MDKDLRERFLGGIAFLGASCLLVAGCGSETSTAPPITEADKKQLEKLHKEGFNMDKARSEMQGKQAPAQPKTPASEGAAD